MHRFEKALPTKQDRVEFAMVVARLAPEYVGDNHEEESMRNLCTRIIDIKLDKKPENVQEWAEETRMYMDYLFDIMTGLYETEDYNYEHRTDRLYVNQRL